MTLKGRFIIKSVLRGQDALILGPGPDQNLVNNASARPDGIVWELAPSGSNDGVIIENVKFKTFLKVNPKERGTIVKTGTREQATSFAITSAGDNTYYVKLDNEDLAWTASPLTVEDSPVIVEGANGERGQHWYFIPILRD